MDGLYVGIDWWFFKDLQIAFCKLEEGLYTLWKKAFRGKDYYRVESELCRFVSFCRSVRIVKKRNT
jgi:hypothetical protein